MASKQRCYSGSLIACYSLILTFKQLYLNTPQSGKVTPATCTIYFLWRDIFPQRKGVLARLYIITEPWRQGKETRFIERGGYANLIWNSELTSRFVDSDCFCTH